MLHARAAGFALLAAVAGVARADTVTIGGAKLAVYTNDVDADGAQRRWIVRSGEMVAGFYGRFPVAGAELVIDRDRSGHEISTRGTVYWRVMATLGDQVSAADLDGDLQLVERFFRLGLPRVDGPDWFSEGLATYLTYSVAAANGDLPRDEARRRLFAGLASDGRPRVGDFGLDGLEPSARARWGGVLFWLLADLEIRERSHGRRSVGDVARAVSEGCAADRPGVTPAWKIERLLELGDAAVGLDTLERLHARMGKRSLAVDLEALKKRLAALP